MVKKRGTLVAGIKTDYPPFGYIDEKGNNAGFDIEIAKYIANKLGVGLELRTVTSGNRIPMLQSNTVDLFAGEHHHHPRTLERRRLQRPLHRDRHQVPGEEGQWHQGLPGPRRARPSPTRRARPGVTS